MQIKSGADAYSGKQTKYESSHIGSQKQKLLSIKKSIEKVD